MISERIQNGNKRTRTTDVYNKAKETENRKQNHKPKA